MKKRTTNKEKRKNIPGNHKMVSDVSCDQLHIWSFRMSWETKISAESAITDSQNGSCE